ncbi:amidase [Namhaeicola litoreus]|uniref:Amidase n=1 Tax=Namhaeicola litoreus TaxID=1052145 RepID=A0ABW3Y5E8_9FLAO
MKKTLLLFICLISYITQAQQIDSIAVALDIIRLSFDRAEIDSLKSSVQEEAQNYEAIRKMNLPNDLPFSLVFSPPLNKTKIPQKQENIDWDIDKKVELPTNQNDLAFYPVHQLAYLIKNKKISSLELTQIYLNRLKKYGHTLECVITLTDSLALAQAKKADEELKKGIYRGPLHGIPYGAKDLLAVEGYKTTWGAMPYKDQELAQTATVIKKLEEGGAVLVAKLTLGALAWGDVWYGGKTRNPWNLEEGSSGSSAGSASATVAGLVPFAIGSETWGSIVSPSTVCGATGLRPTFGRVSKHGAMALSWSMDKLGPICRNAVDCALVLEVIRGEDGLDASVQNYPFNYKSGTDVRKLRIGYLSEEFSKDKSNRKNDSTTIALLKSKGIQLIEKKLPSSIPVYSLSFILSAEAGAAFDELTRSNRDTLLVRQIKNAWPNVFRASRLIPAVEYIQANRLRHQLTTEFNDMMQDIDVLIAPSFSSQLLMSNLTGHPCVVLPNGSYAENKGGSITLLGNHFDEANILSFARYIQEITSFEEEHPSLFTN